MSTELATVSMKASSPAAPFATDGNVAAQIADCAHVATTKEQAAMSEGLGGRPFTLHKSLLYLSGLASVAATLPGLLFYAFGQPWGTISDFSYGVFALVLSFELVSFNPIYKLSTSRISELTRVLGLISFPGGSIASFLLAASEVAYGNWSRFGVLTPAQPGLQDFLFVLQFLFLIPILIWFPLFGTVMKRAGIANSLKMSLISLIPFGYPIWAVWLARQRLGSEKVKVAW